MAQRLAGGIGCPADRIFCGGSCANLDTPRHNRGAATEPVVWTGRGAVSVTPSRGCARFAPILSVLSVLEWQRITAVFNHVHVIECVTVCEL